jgi:Ca2+-binding EF-hand superfamily protein
LQFNNRGKKKVDLENFKQFIHQMEKSVNLPSSPDDLLEVIFQEMDSNENGEIEVGELI